MPFNKEQRKVHYEANKEAIKQKRRKRYLTSKGQVEQNQIKNVLPNQVGQIVLPLKSVLPKNIVLPEKEGEQKLFKVEQSERGEQKDNVIPNFVIPENVKPPPCSRCSEIENSISNFANLYWQE